MCGIVGVIPKALNGFKTNQQKMLYQLLHVGLLRGDDATGVIAVDGNMGFHIMKDALDGYSFAWSFQDSKADKAMYRAGRAVIGHNRAKTVGENVKENAHPFVVDNTFAMVHNGTLTSHKHLAETTVDSEALAITFKKAMDEEDWKEALEKAMGRVYGAYATVWFDQKRKQLCLLRNSQRPLSIVHTPDTIILSSEGLMGAWIASRNGERIENVEEVKVHTLYQFDLEEGGGKYTETTLTPFYQSTVTTTTRHGGRDETGTKLTPVERSSLFSSRNTLSKNQFKKLSRSLDRNSFITFVMDDFVEQDYPATGSSKIFILGKISDKNTLSSFPHAVRCLVDLQDHKLTQQTALNVKAWVGKIKDFSYDSKGQQAVFWLMDAYPLTDDVAVVNNENQSTTH